MLGDVQTVEARLVGDLDEGKTLIEELRHRPLCVLDMIEKSNLHGYPLLTLHLDRRG